MSNGQTTTNGSTSSSDASPGGEKTRASTPDSTSTTVFSPADLSNDSTATKPTVNVPQARVLVIDDSRLVRASIIKQLKGVFDYVEASDGQTGWEMIVLDPTIRVVVSDLNMPKLDGYQLLEKIRSSNVTRIAKMPVVIISGNEEQAAKAGHLGATEFITKGVSTLELLSRLDVLMRLSHTTEQLVAAHEQAASPDASGISTQAFLDVETEKMWAFSRRHGVDFIFLCVRLDEIKGLAPELGSVRNSIRERVFGFVAEMLAKTMRKEDCIARTGDNEYLVGTLGISPTGAIKFATRLAQAISGAKVVYAGETLGVTASFGVAAASQAQVNDLAALRAVAARRCALAQKLGGHRVVGVAEEGIAKGDDKVGGQPALGLPPMTIVEALNLIARGRQSEVLPYASALRKQVGPLIDLLEQAQAGGAGSNAT
jgi:diguanylate cyclase (GGDEF)-like protein